METYQLSNLITTVRKRAKDTTFDSDLLTDFIQETHNQILTRSRWPFMEVQDTATVSKGDTDVTLDDDLEVILSLHLIDANGSAWSPMYLGYAEFFDRYDPNTDSASMPHWYTIYGGTVVFQSPADRDYSVDVRYLKTPTVLTNDTDEPDIPERFKEVLIRGALARVEEYRGNYDIAALHERKVEELTEDMLSRLSLKQLARPHVARFGRR